MRVQSSQELASGDFFAYDYGEEELKSTPLYK